MLMLYVSTYICPATDYYVSTTGVRSGPGTSLATAWTMDYAFTNASQVYTLGADRLIVAGGTYTGYLNAAGGGTNSYDFRCDHTGTPTVNGFLEIVPLYDGKVIFDIRRLQFTKGGQRFWDCEFTDSSRSTKNNASWPMLDIGAFNPTDQQFINCHFYDCSGSAPNNCLTVRGCISLFGGSEFHEHFLYAQSTITSFTPLIEGNLVYGQAGEAIKYINGGYNANTRSNLFIACGRYSAPAGPNSTIIHQIGNDYTNASNIHLYRNYFLATPEDSVAGGVNPVLWLMNGSKDSLNLNVHDNYVMSPDGQIVGLGNGANQGSTNYNFIFKTNTLVGNIVLGYNVRVSHGTQLASTDWDYNTWIVNGTPSSNWQWAKDSGGVSTLSTTLAQWTNSTLGGASGHWDVNSTYQTGTYGGDKWEVMPDPVTPGRGHLLAVNNTGQTTHAFDLTPIGLSDGQPYVLMYAGSFNDTSKWVTNTFTAASPNLTITLTDAAWPISTYKLDGQGLAGYTVLTASNTLPRIGAWLVYPSPTPPTITVTPSGDRTSRAISWSGSSRWGKVVIKRSVNSGAYSTLATVTLPTLTYNDTGLTPGSTYDYWITAANGYAESKISQFSDSGLIPAPPPAPTNQKELFILPSLRSELPLDQFNSL